MAFFFTFFHISIFFLSYDVIEWTADTGSILASELENRSGSLVADKHEIVIISKNQIIRHVPKFLLRLTFFLLKHGGTLTVKVMEERRYSHNFPQRGMEIAEQYV